MYRSLLLSGAAYEWVEKEHVDTCLLDYDGDNVEVNYNVNRTAHLAIGS